ncbi:MAG: hypothetical protein A2Z04_05830 [Chloroflexi bacterium RBG_16_57_9]|nr:MAG: hypothetical protein A2Z04_05830 [Chloroflexi bacterium RBG_16_57_9]
MMMIRQATNSTTGPAWSNDEKYTQAIASLQRGEWSAALKILTSLRERFPSEAELEKLYEEVKFKAELDSRRNTWLTTCDSTRRDRRRAAQAAMLGVVLMMFLVGLFVFQQRIQPVFNESRTAAEQRSHLQAGAEALAAGNAAAAVIEFEAVLATTPNHPGATEGLARARQQLVLATFYDEGAQWVAQERWKEAQAKYEEIIHLDPQYLDTAARLQAVQTKVQLAQLLQSAKAAFQAQNWRGVIEDLETLRRLDPQYAKEEVEEKLYVGYLQRGRGLLTISGDSLTAVQTVVGLLDSALKLRPQSADVQGEFRLANMYLEGLTSMAAQRFGDAVSQFQTVYDTQPAFANNQVGVWLISALLKYGDALVNSAEYARAMQSYERARKLPGARDSEILPHIIQAYLAAGEAAARTGEYDQAIEQYQLARQVVPEDPAVREHFFKAYADWANTEAQHNELEPAVAHYREALKSIPKLPDDVAAQVAAYAAQAEAEARRGALKRAVPYYRQAVELVLKNINSP